MDLAPYNMMPEVAGRFFTGPPPVKQMWAKILASTLVNGTTLYTWQEMTPYLQTLIPLTGGMSGGPDLNPVIEVNGLALTINSFVRVYPAYFDAVYDMIYYAVGAVGSAGTVSVPDASKTQDGTVNLIDNQVLGSGVKEFSSALWVNADLAAQQGFLQIFFQASSNDFAKITFTGVAGSAQPGAVIRYTDSNQRLLLDVVNGAGTSTALELDAAAGTCDLTGPGSPAYKVAGTAGLTVTITTAKLTPGGANGSMTFKGGILTAQTPAT